ncbi:MAG: addiction module protein [Gemmataceae bacterium]
MPTHLAELLALPAAEKLDIVEALWNSLADDPDALPVPEWHAAELDRRREAAKDTPGAVSTWDEVKQWVVNRHG